MRHFRFVVFIATVLCFANFLKGQTINEKYGQIIKEGSSQGTRILSKKDSTIKFAVMSDIHIIMGSKTIEWTNQCVEDINKDDQIQFVIISGDIANFGSDDELKKAKEILDKLNVPWFIIPGNHDATWSESGTNSFITTFGYERFEFEAGGIKFLGTPCGPNIRMAPALLPRESYSWLKEQILSIDKNQPIFYVNHYPLDTSVLRYGELIDLLKVGNTQLVINGHWHQNRAMQYEGIPGAIIRSTQKDSQREVGYVVVDVDLASGLISFREKIAGEKEPKSPWYNIRMSRGRAFDTSKQYARRPKPSFNQEFPNVKQIWRYENSADIGCAASVYTTHLINNSKGANVLPFSSKEVKSGDIVIFADESGVIKALNATSGEMIWQYQTGGKIFSSPSISHDRVVVGSSDNYIYCLNVKNGRIIWKFRCNKSVLGTANIFKGVVYIGSSDGVFRAIELSSGKLKWENPSMKSFVLARPYVDNQQVVIGDWSNQLYSFDPKDGSLQWIWHTPKGVANFSPAQVWPIKSNGKIIISCPDRFNYQIDAKTGKTLASNYGGREAIGLGIDGNSFYIKSMKDTVKAISTMTLAESEDRYGSSHIKNSDSNGLLDSYKVLWTSIPGYNYEIGPTPITTVTGVGKNSKGLVFIATDKGNIFALNSIDGSLAFRHSVSEALINYIMPIGKNQLLVSTMDGVVTLLQYNL